MRANTGACWQMGLQGVDVIGLAGAALRQTVSLAAAAGV